MSAHPLAGADLKRLLDADTHRALGRLIARRISGTTLPQGGLRSTALSEEYGLMLVQFVACWHGPPSVQLTDPARAYLGLEPAVDRCERPPLHYRPFTDAEARVLSALPPGERRSDQEVAQSTGYSRRYVRDLLAGLWREGLVFKGTANSWIRL